MPSDLPAVRRQERAGWLGGVGYALVLAVTSAFGADGPVIRPEDRARQSLDAASALDAQAQRSASLADARAKWLEAARLLDDRIRLDPPNGATPSLRFQAAVYLWARARSRLDQVDLLGRDKPARVEVAQELDEVIARLRAIAPANDPVPSFAANVQFRTAQALADRAQLRDDNDPLQNAEEKEAQRLVERLGDQPRLRNFARMLHAELGIRLGLAGPAQVELEAIEKLEQPPPPLTILEAKVNALIGRGMSDEAIRLAERATAPADRKSLWRLRALLGQRRQVAAGPNRDALDLTAFRVVRELREGQGPPNPSASPLARRATMELARAIDRPPERAGLEDWDLLVDGYLLLAEPERAETLASQGADRAPGGDADRAASLRFKAGAAAFEAERFAEAQRLLTRVVNQVAAPRALRARAGMLRALALGRAVATRQPGSSRAEYLASLEQQVRDFPGEAASGEARWLLGKVRLAAGRRDEAIELWSGLGHGQTRWLEAQTSAADEAIQAIEEEWVNRDLTAVRPRFRAARAMIQAAIDQAQAEAELVQLQLRLGRLDTIPGLGQPTEAVAVLDRVLHGPATPEQHRQARLDRLVALAEQNRFPEAEAVARVEARSDEFAALRPALRRLDQLADSTENDSIRRRSGSLLRILLDPWADPIDRAPVEARDEISLRHARAVLFAGDVAGTRREIARWGGPSGSFPDPDLDRALGDLYLRLEAYPLAADVARLRVGKLAPGSPAWFDARYNLALALFRSNKTREAAQIIEGTSILHPDLGGGEIRLKFERLGQKALAH